MADIAPQHITNMDILLATVIEPTQLSLILIVVTVFTLIQYPLAIYSTLRWCLVKTFSWLEVPVPESPEQFRTDEDLTTWIDETTAGSWSQLRLMLGLLALQIFIHLVCKNLIKLARFCQRVGLPIYRFAMTFFIICVLVVVIVPSYQMVLLETMRWAGSRIDNNTCVWEPGYQLDSFENELDAFGKFKFSPLQMNSYTERIFNRNNGTWYTHINYNTGQIHLNHYTNIKYFRHNTEDVFLPCAVQFSSPEGALDNNSRLQVWWTFNGTLLDTNQTNRYTFLKHNGRIPWVPADPGNVIAENQWMLQNSLIIHQLQPSDFGLYVCNASISGVQLPCPDHGLCPHKDSREPREFVFHVSTLEVVKLPLITTELYVEPAVGVRMTVPVMVPASQVNDISTEHFINGVPSHQVPDQCRYQISTVLSILAVFEAKSWREVSDHGGGYALAQDIYQFCVEQYRYGLHTFLIRRTFINPQTGLTDSTETEFHKRLLIRPTEPHYFSYVHANAYFSFLNLKECWQNSSMVMSEYCIRKLDWLRWTSRLHLFLDCCVMIFILFIFFPLYYMWYSFKIVKTIVVLMLPEIFARSAPNMFQDQLSCPPQAYSNNTDDEDLDQRYNVFLGYSEEDAAIPHRIKELLQDYQLAVFDSVADVPAGCPVLTAWDRAVLRSDAFVLLLSPAYLTDPQQLLQFQSIHNLVLEHQVNAAHLLLVLTEERCQVPAVLQTIPVARLWQEDWQQRLEHWAMCIKGDVTVQTLFKQIGRDIRRDSHQILALNARHDDVQQLVPGMASLTRRFGPAYASSALTPATHPTPRQNITRRPQANEGQWTPTPDEESEESADENRRREFDDSESDSSTEHSSNESDREESSAMAIPLSAHFPKAMAPMPKSARQEFGCKVFLTYSEESPDDCEIARQVTAALDAQGLRVYDAVRDHPPGEPEIHIVSAAVNSAAFVVIISPAYCQDPMTCRLHFPLVLSAVQQDQVQLQNVLLILTSGMLPASRPHGDDDEDDQEADEDGDDTVEKRRDGEDNENDNSPNDENNDEEDDNADHNQAAGDANDDESRHTSDELRSNLAAAPFQLPRWFAAFPRIHWSRELGLYEEGRFRVWARRLYDQVHSHQHV